MIERNLSLYSVLRQDAARLKSCFSLKTSVQNLVLFQETIEVLVPLESTTLEEPHASIVMSIEGAHIFRLSVGALVPYGGLFAPF